MGDTLVYTSASISDSAPRAVPFRGGAFAHPPLTAALAASSLAAFGPPAMNFPSQPNHLPTRERRATEFAPQIRSAHDAAGAQAAFDTGRARPQIVLRRLPRNTGLEGVRTLLIFAKDLASVQLVDSLAEDDGFVTAVATFNTFASAREAKESLDGKMNSSQDAQIIVDMPTGASPVDAAARLGSRRSTIDGTAARGTAASSASSGNDANSRQASRFSSTFHNNNNNNNNSNSERISPTLTGQPNGDYSKDTSQRYQSLFSPQSPVNNNNNNNSLRHQPNLGKSVINDDAVDDETDGLLRDPLGYARNGRPQGMGRSSLSQVPTAQFGNMSLGSNFEGQLSGHTSGIASPVGVHTPHAGGVAGFGSKMGPQGAYGPAMPPTGPGRTSYPPANPADQNPPCNTLYVGNLPNNTSEDELKRIFSSQRGYKRLCFRTKQNGPMCFVEFENITLATQALHHLYGKMLSNSVKGGIRLSFSKNPLGVRSGQTGLPPNPMSPQGGFPGFGAGVAPPPGFHSPSGPPPGLPGGRGPGFVRPAFGENVSPMYQAHQYSMSGAPFASQLRMPPSTVFPNGSPSPAPGVYGPHYYEAGGQ